MLLVCDPSQNYVLDARHGACSSTGSTTGCKVSRDVADGAVMIFRVVDSNISSKFSTFHSNVSDFLAVVAKDGTGPNAIGCIVSRSLTVTAKARVGHGSGYVKSSDVLRHYSGG